MRAVVFDFDGVILDTETPEFEAWRELYAAHGCELTLDDWAASIGTDGAFDPWATLAARAPRPLPPEQEARAAKRARVRELLDGAGPLPGVLDWLDEAEARGLPVGIASTSAPDWIEPHLERLGIRARFACIACCDGSLPPKPDPSSYRAACERLGVRPADAIAVEDSPNGIAAATAAGLFTVAVPNPLTGSLDLSGADLLVESLAALPLGPLLDGVHP